MLHTGCPGSLGRTYIATLRTKINKPSWTHGTNIECCCCTPVSSASPSRLHPWLRRLLTGSSAVTSPLSLVTYSVKYF